MMCKTVLAVVGLAAIAGSIAIAQPAKETKPATQPSTTPTTTPAAKPATTPAAKPADPAAKPAGQPEFQLPAGWTEADMQACAEAGTPGPNHAFLAKSAGVWTGKVTMWMTPDSPPVQSECTATYKTIMDGRFTTAEVAGDMPGMGPFTGTGTYGYDNVSKKFQATWICNCGTGIMFGTGDLSSDGSTLTWTYTANCPINKKPTTMRDVERHTGKDTMTLTSFMNDPKSGKEFKMMEIAYTRQGAGAR